MLGNPAELKKQAAATGVSLDGMEIVDPATTPNRQVYQELLAEKRAHRGMTLEKAQAELDSILTFACMMVAANHADGCVAGAITPTALVVRTAMQLIGKAHGVKQISSLFIMLLLDQHPVDDVLVMADCALVIDPDSDTLAAIAVATGESTKQLLALEPRIGMLSFSTYGSARHSKVSKIAKATDLARTQKPDWQIIGEVQLDAAVLPNVLKHKAPLHAVSEPCNILVFPNLDAGNIGYKLIERFGGAQAIGPVLQGLAKPVNDLSRGCSVADIVNIIAVTAAQCTDETSPDGLSEHSKPTYERQ